MLSERLSYALDTGAFVVPDTGTIAVFGAREFDDLAMLPKERTEVIQTFRPDHAGLASLGWTTLTAAGGPYALSIVVLPRARRAAELRIAEAVALTGGPVIVDGQKTDGVESLLKEVRRRTPVETVISKAHGKLFVFEGGDFSDWQKAGTDLVVGRFRTAPGVFSADGVDPGSEALAAALPRALKGRVVDLGAGWGYLADAILFREGVTHLDLVEADLTALDCARLNIADPRAEFHWADALSFAPASPADHVVTNPPFHRGREGDPDIGRGFIAAAASMLGPRGQLWLVANRHLPYERALSDAFHDVQPLALTPSFKLFHATSPKRPRKG